MIKLERLKELKFQEENEQFPKKHQKEGALIIIEQIKEREHERLRHKEVLEKERVLILKQIKELEEEGRAKTHKRRRAFQGSSRDQQSLVDLQGKEEIAGKGA